MKKIVFRKVERKLTPSGAWDNGLYVVVDRYVEFPLPLFESKAIVESVMVKIDDGACGHRPMMSVMQVTVDGRSWTVCPGGKVEIAERLG